jgi:hypothetical protein
MYHMMMMQQTYVHVITWCHESYYSILSVASLCHMAKICTHHLRSYHAEFVSRGSTYVCMNIRMCVYIIRICEDLQVYVSYQNLCVWFVLRFVIHSCYHPTLRNSAHRSATWLRYVRMYVCNYISLEFCHYWHSLDGCRYCHDESDLPSTFCPGRHLSILSPDQPLNLAIEKRPCQTRITVIEPAGKVKQTNNNVIDYTWLQKMYAAIPDFIHCWYVSVWGDILYPIWWKLSMWCNGCTSIYV